MKKLTSFFLAFVFLFTSSLVTHASSSWTVKSPLPQGLYFLATASVDGKVYAMGGYNASHPVPVLYEYTPSTDKWVRKADMPEARAGLTATSYNGKIYVFGGSWGSTTNAKVFEYNPKTDTWTQKSTPPVHRNGAVAVTLNNKIYLVGGGWNSTAYTNVDVYDPQTDSWTTEGKLNSTYGEGFGAAAAEGKIYIFGRTQYESYDPSTKTAKIEGTMPKESVYHSAVSLNNKIYISGGQIITYTGGVATASVTMFDPTTNSFTEKESMNDTRFRHSTVATDNKIYAIGGHYTDRVEEYTLTGTDTNPQLPDPIYEDANRAILTINLTSGIEKEYDLTMAEINAFIAWYDSKASGSGPSYYIFNKNWNKGPYKSRTEYIIFDKIVTFSIDEYTL
ncbi:Kelch repeat-containing protein [Paenibacillus tarimensis]|uniref:Kelch repeat-containing protein n=1 Tax=Paenibacillus tarimensis TaxID=416012 RepID=UPI001F2F4FD8|nr:kelch repeat-containing protein [Paenibacillus tarimensis]MCF2945756.1 hypothetical protein [Paenibacillus tarimensis]